MVKIAIAGGSGNVAQEVIDVLVASKKHEIVILSRKDVVPDEEAAQGITWARADYNDPEQLKEILQGVHTVLSFIPEMDDQKSPRQKNLIDAAVQAGVKRFAPSEWASSRVERLSWYAYKGETRRYLEQLNKDKKVLEYTLFQPGFFLNYLTHPYMSSKHLHSVEVPFDFANRRALLLDGSDDDRVTFTTVQDIAQVVARAVDFEGEWPVIGGIKGSDITMGELIALGERVRGGTPFEIEKLKARGLETGEWKSSWVPRIDHPSLAPEVVDAFSRVIVAGILLAISAGDYEVSDEWNRLLPDYKFTQIEGFLEEAWRGKP